MQRSWSWSWSENIGLVSNTGEWIQSTNVTDRRTPGDSKDRAYVYRRAVKWVGCDLLTVQGPI